MKNPFIFCSFLPLSHFFPPFPPLISPNLPPYSQLPLCLFSTLWVAQRLHKEHTFRTFSQFDDAEVQKVQHGIQWTSRQLAVYPVIALLAGALAGLLGIGGGMVIGPLLLELGVLPQVIKG